MFRDLAAAAILWKMASCIDPICRSLVQARGFSSPGIVVTRWVLYVLYWFWQGILGTSLWLIGLSLSYTSLD